MKKNLDTQLLHYWKDFESNLKASRVGWLGVRSSSKKFQFFNSSISEHSDSWIISFRKEKGKCFPVAVLKAIKEPIVDVVNDQKYVDFVYFDPWKSFTVNRPTDTTDLRKFYELGAEIASHFSVECTFQGQSGLQLISNDEMLRLISKAREFKGNDLEIYAGARLPVKGSRTESPVFDKEQPAEGPDQTNPIDEFLKNKLSHSVAPDIDAAPKADLQSTEREDLQNISNQVFLEYSNKPGEDVDAIVKRRIGQGPFRTLLQKTYGTTCWLSGLADSRSLIASHIVPWSLSDAIQKTDPENGLLLSVSWDALFDKGYVSFDDDGHLICSDLLNEDTVKCLGLSKQSTISRDFMTPTRKKNMAEHRQKHGFKV
jgi:hypothetical protein